MGNCFLFVLHGITIDSLEQPFPLKLVGKLCVQERKKKQIVSPSCHFHGLIVILLTILVDQKVLQKKLYIYNFCTVGVTFQEVRYVVTNTSRWWVE